MNDEMLAKAQMLQNESREVEKNLKIINEHIEDLTKFNENLEFLEGNGEKEILASLGRGVYVRSNIAEEKKFFVEVGAGIIVKKTPKETRAIIEEQIRKFHEARVQLNTQLELYASEFRRMLKDVKEIKAEREFLI